MGVSVIKKTKSKLYEEKSAIEKLLEIMLMLRDKKYLNELYYKRKLNWLK